jgi:hypothetical protein
MKRLALIFILALTACNSDTYSDISETEYTLNLKWNKAYPDDTIDKSVLGLQWAFSYMGAKLANPSSVMNIVSEKTITVNLREMGFNETALQKMRLLSDKIKLSGEYQKTNAIDLGRYVTLLLGAPEHYYAITGVPKRLDDLLAQYTLLPEKGYVNNSGVSHEHRVIRFSDQVNLNQVFLSQETDPNTGEVYEYETLEIIPNGQVRFGIFDPDGNRKVNADPEYSNAGKPAKCMWCHESTISQMFTEQDDFNGYLTGNQLQATLINYNQMLTQRKLAIQGGVDFSQTQQHTLAELLYISFMEPSAERLSREWSMPLNQVQALLSGLTTHTYDEFPFLGALYYRNEIEDLAPFPGLEVSSKVREQSPIEVNYLQ